MSLPNAEASAIHEIGVNDIAPRRGRAYVAYRLAAVAREGLGAGGSAGAG